MKILYILLALLILMVLITVHEFGHYLAGKIFKFKINEFSIGFGPALYKKTKKNGEVFSVRALPLGGYCAFEGEDENPEEVEAAEEQSEKQNNLASAEQKPQEQVVKVPQKTFNSEKAWKRLIVLFGGVLFNFMFGIITSAIYLMVAGYGVPMVAASTQSAIVQGDKIIAINGTKIEAYRPMSDILAQYKNQNTLSVLVERDGQKQTVVLEKKEFEHGYYYVSNTQKVSSNLYKKEADEYVQVSMEEFQQDVINAPLEQDTTDQKYYPILQAYYRKDASGNIIEEPYSAKQMISDKVIGYANPGKSLGIMYYTVAEHYGFFECLLKAWPFGFYICKVILGALGGLFTGATKISDLGGTITTISVIADYSSMNPLIILYLFPLLSFNLAIFNILPIPSLDGARMCFVLWEMVTRKPVNRKVEGYIHTIGLFVLLALVIFLDVYHLFI